MSIEFDIARRYLTQKKETGFITLISYISIAGIMIGVAALILTLGVLNGFEQTIVNRILQFQTHIRLETYDNQGFTGGNDVAGKLSGYPEIAAISPFVEKEIMLRYKRRSEAVMVRGVDTARLAAVIDLDLLKEQGEFDLGVDGNGDYGIVLGSDIGEKFGLHIGDPVVLWNPLGMSSGLAGRPRISQFSVRGFFESGYSEFDNLFAFIDLYEAQSLLQLENKLSGFDVQLHDIDDATPLARKLTIELGYPFFVRTWLDINQTIFDWMKVQRLPILIAFGMIILVGGINLISTQILIILEKQRDIGILKSMGITSQSVLKIFFLIGGIVGLTAAAAGSLLALGLGWIQNTYHVISLAKDVYFIGELPIDLRWQSFIQIGLVAVGLCLAATVYPAWKASKSLPSETIRQV